MSHGIKHSEFYVFMSDRESFGKRYNKDILVYQDDICLGAITEEERK